MKFDRFAANYAANARFQQQIAGQLVRDFSPTGMGIDLGSGTGFVGQALAANADPMDWIEVDRSSAMLGRSAHSRRVCADATRLPFASNCFDWGVSSLALQWIGRSDEWFRVLKPGAPYRAVVVLPESLPELRSAMANIGRHTDVFSRYTTSYWAEQLPGVSRLESRTLNFSTPREALASVRDIGAGGHSGVPLKRDEYRCVLDALGCQLTYHLMWINGACPCES